MYSHYEENEIWDALENTMNVFRNIAIDVSELLNIKYPYEADEFATNLVESFYSENEMARKGTT
nr:aminoglycoside 6-adenylyltransferase [Sporosarcina sp. ANT_H38]